MDQNRGGGRGKGGPKVVPLGSVIPAGSQRHLLLPLTLIKVLDALIDEECFRLPSERRVHLRTARAMLLRAYRLSNRADVVSCAHEEADEDDPERALEDDP